MKKIYIAGPYTGNEVENTNRMIDVYNELVKAGHIVYCPLLSHFANERHKEKHGEEIHYFIWMKLDIHLIQSGFFDILVFLGSSPGADRELQVAEFIGMEIVYNWKSLVK